MEDKSTIYWVKTDAHLLEGHSYGKRIDLFGFGEDSHSSDEFRRILNEKGLKSIIPVLELLPEKKGNLYGPKKFVGYEDLSFCSYEAFQTVVNLKDPEFPGESLRVPKYEGDQQHIGKVLDFSNNDGEYGEWREKLREDFNIELVEIWKRDFRPEEVY